MPMKPKQVASRGKPAAIFRRLYRTLFDRPFTSDRDTFFFLLREGTLAAGAAALALLSLPFGAKPLGFALVAAAGAHLPAVTLGCLISCAVKGEILRFLLLAAEGAVLFVLRRHFRKEESTLLPGRLVACLAAAICAIPPAMPRFATEGFTFHALFAFLTELSVAVVFTLLLLPLQEKDGAVDPLRKLPGRAALCAALCFAAAGVTLFGLPPAAGLGLLLILYSCKHFDPLTTAAVGLCCGLGCGSETVPAMVACSAAAILVRRFSKKLYVAAAILAAMLAALYAGGFPALTGTLPSLVAGGCFYALLFRLDEMVTPEKEEAAAKPSDPEQTLFGEALAGERETASALLALSGELSELSEAMRTPDRERLLFLCDESFGDLCKGDDRLLQTVDRVALVENAAAMLQKRGTLEIEDLPQWFREHCPKSARRYVESCNRRCAALRRMLREDDRASDFAACYRNTAKLLQDGTKRRREELLPDQNLSLKAAEAAKALGLRFERASVRGKGKLRLALYGVDLTKLGVSAAKLQTVLGKACEVPFGPPKISMEGTTGRLEMESLPTLRFDRYEARRRKEGELVCGDELAGFENEEAFCALLSDGMGSGREASAAAKFCCCMAKHLLSCGGSPTAVARSIGEFLLHQSGECSATLDMMQADPRTGKAIFLKCGAVPTFILRDGGIFKITAASMPLGITTELNAECVTAKLLPGDLVVICSDGVVPDLDAEVKLCKLLISSAGASLSVLAELICERAAGKDDASVVMIRVSEADTAEQKSA